MTIDPTTATTNPTSGQGPKPNVLGQDAFLTLLTTQLAHQDPTKPLDDTQFIAQLAQFSSLEKLTTMDKTLADIMRLLSRDTDTSATATPPAAVSPAGTAQDSVTTRKGTN